MLVEKPSRPICDLGAQDTMCVAHLDPQAVRPSRWPGRHPSAFAHASFQQLKAEIASSQGNVQPIKVRELGSGLYEIVFGHRRHRACQELCLPVLATIAPRMSDQSAWQEMERENRARRDLSPYEQGRHYRAALDAGLYPSIRSLALAVGVDVSQAAKVIRIADLPSEVIEAFGSPSVIQVNWSGQLTAAVQLDPTGIRRRSTQILATDGPKRAPKEVLAALTGQGGRLEPFQTPLEIANPTSGARATITVARFGFDVRITGGGVSLPDLEAALRRLLSA